MTTPEFADAVKKGLGRAILAVDGHVSEEFANVVIHACMVDQRYDKWSEHGRAHYLMCLAEKAKLSGKLLPLLLAPLEEDDGPREKRLRKFMLGEFARRGEQRSWDILKQLAVNSDDVTWEVIADIGPTGLEWLSKNVVGQLPIDEKYRIKYWKEDCAGDLTSMTEDILNKAIKDFEKYQSNQPQYSPYEVPRTLDEALDEIKSKKSRLGSLHWIGKRLNHDEVVTVANLWLNERDVRIGGCYAKLFDVRSFPLPIHFVADRVLASIPPIDFEDVLSVVNDPICRQLGLHLIRQSRPDWRGYACLVSSYLEEDIPYLMDSPKNFVGLGDDDLHNLCSALRHICNEIPPTLREPALLWNYENNPCSFCRTTIVEMMIEDGSLSDYHRRELEFDASSDSRQLVAKQA